MFGVGKKVTADENRLGQFVMVEMLSQRLRLNQDELQRWDKYWKAPVRPFTVGLVFVSEAGHLKLCDPLRCLFAYACSENSTLINSASSVGFR